MFQSELARTLSTLSVGANRRSGCLIEDQELRLRALMRGGSPLKSGTAFLLRERDIISMCGLRCRLASAPKYNMKSFIRIKKINGLEYLNKSPRMLSALIVGQLMK